MGLGIAGPPCDSPGKQAIRRQAGEAGGRAPTMADGNEKTWWRRTRFLAVTAVMTGGAASLLIMLAAPALDADSVLGIPFGLFAVTLIAPLGVAAVIFWADERQRRIDRAHGFES
jgi:putative solute:sodium symporter small subunit